jgi:hypothetical protein
MPPVTENDLINWFQYHLPTADQQEKYVTLREAGLTLAKTILETTPAGADQTAAIRKVRESIMTANAAIACALPETVST